MAAPDTAWFSRFTSFSFHMGQQRSPHLWNAAILVVSVLAALAAERASRTASRTAFGARAAARVPATVVSPGSPDVGAFVRPVRPDTLFAYFHPVIQPDPFAAPRPRPEENIASADTVPTVPSAPAPGNR